MVVQGTAARGFSRSSAHCAGFKSKRYHGFKRGRARCLLLPLAQVSREVREKEAGGGRATTPTGRVQHGTVQRSLGKTGGAHGRWDLCVSPTQSASERCVLIIRVSFCCCAVVLFHVCSTIRPDVAVCYGVFTPSTDGNNRLVFGLDSRRAVERSCILESSAEFGRLRHPVDQAQRISTPA